MIQMKVNGTQHSFNGDPGMTLLWYIRDNLGLTGTKFGCGIALCGACTVHKKGEAIRSCVTPMSTAGGAEITTIEGSSQNGLHPVQRAWMEPNVPQCGYCQSGQIMQAIAFCSTKPNRAIQRLKKRWPAISADVELINEFAPRSKLQRRPNHEQNRKPQPPPILERHCCRGSPGPLGARFSPETLSAKILSPGTIQPI